VEPNDAMAVLAERFGTSIKHLRMNNWDLAQVFFCTAVRMNKWDLAQFRNWA